MGQFGRGLIAAGILVAGLNSVLAQARQFVGFDRNDYPGDAALPTLRQHFDFAGYWLTNPPGAKQNSWVGKREMLRAQGFGFLLLADGRTDAQIRSGSKSGGNGAAAALGKKDAVAAVAAARREGFPVGAVIFLDQEEGGRLLPEQADYLFGWTEAVAAAGFRAGVYGSGVPVDDGPGMKVTTAQDIREQVASRHLQPVMMWVYQDTCPPSNGCMLKPPPLASSGTRGAEVWQYAQSPRRRENTLACAKTYAADGSCVVSEAGLARVHLDLNVAESGDPSAGR